MACAGPSWEAHAGSSSSMSINPSPELNNIDTFISDILQAVNDPNDDTPICNSCEEGIVAWFRCRECDEPLCNPCVKAHQRVKVTKEHSIIKMTRSRWHSGPSTSGSSGSSQTMCVSPSGMDLATSCDIHLEPLLLFCEACMSPLCKECTLLDHRDHPLLYIQDAVESAKNNLVKLGQECRNAICAVKDAIDTVKVMSDSIEAKTQQAAAQVHDFVKRFISAAEEREDQLLRRIEHCRQLKGSALSAQMDLLNRALSRLINNSDVLNDAMETGSDLETIEVNEKVARDLTQLRCIKPDLLPCEDDNIVFATPDQNLLKAVQCMGNICFQQLSINRVRPPNNHLYMPNHMLPVELKSNERKKTYRGPPRGRPVYGINKPIVVRESDEPIVAFGKEGEDDGQLCRPWGVCCDKLGNIFVADRSNNRVQIFYSDGTFCKKFGSQGFEPGQFDRPAGIAIDPFNRIIVADKDNHRIQIFTMDGTFIRLFGEKGTRNGQFNYPWDVATNTQGLIVVSDTRNHRIQLFSSEGTYLNKYGFEGTSTMWKHFDSPRGVCFSPNGSVLVTDFNNHRLVIINPKFNHAQFLGSEGNGSKQFMRPQGIVCDDEGKIIVADSRNNRVQVFESTGTFIAKLGSSGSSGNHVGQLDRPSGICITPNGRVVVVDFGNNRIQIF